MLIALGLLLWWSCQPKPGPTLGELATVGVEPVVQEEAPQEAVRPEHPPPATGESCQDWPDVPFEPAASTGSSYLPVEALPAQIDDMVHPDGMMRVPPIPPYASAAYLNLLRNVDLLLDMGDPAYMQPIIQAKADGLMLFQAAEMDRKKVATVGLYPGPNNLNVAIIHINYVHLGLAYQDPQRVVKVQMALVHEFEHYKQFVGAANAGNFAEADTFLYRPDHDTRTLTHQECVLLWDHEYRAFVRGCEFWLSTGISVDGFEICRRVNTPAAFRQRLFTMVPYPECRPTWGQLAGHPNPGACTL